jgi:hypothetical protein
MLKSPSHNLIDLVIRVENCITGFNLSHFSQDLCDDLAERLLKLVRLILDKTAEAKVKSEIK